MFLVNTLVKKITYKLDGETMVRAKKLLALLGGLALLLGLAAGASAQDFENSFTISAVAVSCDEATGLGEFDFTVDITLTNYSGSDLSNIKIQGGTAAWVTVVSAPGLDQVENPHGKLLPAKSGKATKNNNVILGATGLSLDDGYDTMFTVVVNGSPDLEECPDGPNVLGSWSASGMNELGEDVEAIAVDAMGDVVLEDDMETPATETPEVLACDEAFGVEPGGSPRL
jgi:hypothetical protein